MGGTCQSVRLPVRRPSAAGRFCQKLTVGGRLKGEIDRRRSIEREKGKKKEKKKRRKKEKRRRRISSACSRSSLARRCCPRVAALFLPRGEKDRGDALVQMALRKGSKQSGAQVLV
ncbi:hypothetical protein BHM03_00012708, partial [Ensete ventricosum]